MISASRLPAKFEVSFYRLPLALGANSPVRMFACVNAVVNVTAVKQRIILTMSDDNFAECLCPLHSLFHHFLRLNTSAVVGKSDYVLCHTLHIGKLFAVLTDGNCSVRQNIYNSVLFYYVKLLLQVLRRVGYRLQIRH